MEIVFALSTHTNNPSYHRVLRRFEIENYLFDKEVLKEYCLLYKTIFDEESYDSYVTDIYNQNLKDETGRISSEIFKINLSKCINSSMSVYKELEQDIFWNK